MPSAEPAWLPTMVGRIGENSPDEGQQSRALTEPLFSLLEAVSEVFFEYRVVEE